MKVLQKITALKLPKGFKKEIIVVDDGSTDSSKFKVQSLKFKGLKKLFHEKNMGKGAAIRTGIKNSSGDIVIIQDADLEYDPNDYPKLLKPILLDNALVVYGSRLINYPFRLWGENKTVLPLHLLANKGLTFLTNLLYGSNLTDMETCYKLFRKEVLQKIHLESKGFDIEPEITAKILKLKIPITEIPIKVTPRTYQEGKKISWQDGVIAIWTLMKYKFLK